MRIDDLKLFNILLEEIKELQCRISWYESIMLNLDEGIDNTITLADVTRTIVIRDPNQIRVLVISLLEQAKTKMTEVTMSLEEISLDYNTTDTKDGNIGLIEEVLTKLRRK